MNKLIVFIAIMFVVGSCFANEDVQMQDDAYEFSGEISEVVDFSWFQYSPAYICSVHGEADSFLTFEFTNEYEDLNGSYCVYCIAEFMMDNFSQLEKKE